METYLLYINITIKTKFNLFQISELLFLGESATSTQAVAWGLVTREISSKNDKDFEEKVMQITKEAVQGKYTEVSW